MKIKNIQIQYFASKFFKKFILNGNCWRNNSEPCIIDQDNYHFYKHYSKGRYPKQKLNKKDDKFYIDHNSYHNFLTYILYGKNVYEREYNKLKELKIID